MIPDSVPAGNVLGVLALEILGYGFTQHCGPTLLSDRGVSIELVEEGFVEGDLYGFHERRDCENVIGVHSYANRTRVSGPWATTVTICQTSSVLRSVYVALRRSSS